MPGQIAFSIFLMYAYLVGTLEQKARTHQNHTLSQLNIYLFGWAFKAMKRNQIVPYIPSSR